MSRSGFVALVTAVGVVGFCAVLFVAGSAARVQPAPGSSPAPGAPFMPALDGKVECLAPNLADHTCHAMSAFRRGADGQIEETSSTLLLRGPIIIMRYATPVTFEPGRVCATVTRRALESASFTVDGEPTSAAQLSRFRSVVTRGFARFVGHEDCTSYVTNGDSMLSFASLDGAPLPSLTQKVIFVSPGDGYVVGP